MKERLIKKFEDEIHVLNHELKLELPKEIKRARELGDRTWLIASMTCAETVATSTAARASAASRSRRSSVSREAGVTAASWIPMPAPMASATRCAPSRSMTPSPSPRAASRKRATSGLWRLVMVTPEG